MFEMTDCDVLIVGAGPVGLTLAIDLAWRGIDVTVVELRAAGEPPNVKCNQVSARSMEVYRRLGIARKLREGGLPGDYPIDVISCTTMTGIELSRLSFPSRNGRLAGAGLDLAHAGAVAPYQPDLLRALAVRTRRAATENSHHQSHGV
jgi:2-polyprenyl-6-methoxyphenol hydroxylase-like FAD-dependent oxidoreductase